MDIPSRSHYCPVRFEARCVVIRCSDLNDIRPAVNIALAVVIEPYSDHGPVRFEAHGLMTSCDLNDIRPAGHTIVLAMVIPSHSDHCPV